MTNSDVVLERKADGNFKGFKILSGHEEQVKKVVLDTLVTETDWISARNKIDDGVGKIIGKDLNTYFFDYSKDHNTTVTF